MPIYQAQELIALTKIRKAILVFGPPITGKTYSLWTLVRWLKQNNLGKLHLFDLDRKCESLVRKLDKEKLLDYLLVYQYTPPDKLGSGATQPGSKDLFVAFQNDYNKYWDNVEPNTGAWKSTYTDPPGAIFIDSLTRFQEIVMDYIISSLGRPLGAPNTDARADYGKQMQKVMEAVQSLKSLPCITGWLAHDQMEKDEILGKIVVLPNVTGKKLPSMLAKEFNCVLYSVVQQVADKATYKWQVSPQGWVQSAGVTSRDDLPVFVEQDYAKVF